MPFKSKRFPRVAAAAAANEAKQDNPLADTNTMPAEPSAGFDTTSQGENHDLLENETLRAENTALRAENTALRAENTALRAENAALRAELFSKPSAAEIETLRAEIQTLRAQGEREILRVKQHLAKEIELLRAQFATHDEVTKLRAKVDGMNDAAVNMAKRRSSDVIGEAKKRAKTDGDVKMGEAGEVGEHLEEEHTEKEEPEYLD
ncbi:hypothetical protein V8F20_003488 [Naviculisporaceae sp. PSN 640]